MKEIVLSNRYNDEVKLVHQEGNDYLLHMGGDGWLRVGKNNEGEIAFVDPSGGPFLALGHKVENKTIEKIEFKQGTGYILTLKEDETN